MYIYRFIVKYVVEARWRTESGTENLGVVVAWWRDAH